MEEVYRPLLWFPTRRTGALAPAGTSSFPRDAERKDCEVHAGWPCSGPTVPRRPGLQSPSAPLLFQILSYSLLGILGPHFDLPTSPCLLLQPLLSLATPAEGAVRLRGPVSGDGHGRSRPVTLGGAASPGSAFAGLGVFSSAAAGPRGRGGGSPAGETPQAPGASPARLGGGLTRRGPGQPGSSGAAARGSGAPWCPRQGRPPRKMAGGGPRLSPRVLDPSPRRPREEPSRLLGGPLPFPQTTAGIPRVRATGSSRAPGCTRGWASGVRPPPLDGPAAPTNWVRFPPLRAERPLRSGSVWVLSPFPVTVAPVIYLLRQEVAALPRGFQGLRCPVGSHEPRVAIEPLKSGNRRHRFFILFSFNYI